MLQVDEYGYGKDASFCVLLLSWILIVVGLRLFFSKTVGG